jgi:hypothetical protein
VRESERERERERERESERERGSERERENENYELIRTVLGNQTNVEQFLEVADQRNLVA